MVCLRSTRLSVHSVRQSSAPKTTEERRQSQQDRRSVLNFLKRKEYANAIALLRPKAEGGDSWAQFQLGKLYFNGNGIELDKAIAFGWFLKSAEQGYALAQYRLGMMYHEGQGVQTDKAEGFVGTKELRSKI